MTIEELLKPRFKVIADYPGSRFHIGEVLHRYLFDNGNYVYTTNPDCLLAGTGAGKDNVEPYSHLFKPLSWWEERKEEDMPEYVKVKLTNGGIRVYNISGKDFFNKEFMRWKFGGHSLNDFLPAIKEEFESQHTEVKK